MPCSIGELGEPFLTGLLNAIVDFESGIARIGVKRKLRQNRTPERRSRVIDALTQGNVLQHQIAELMSDTLQKEAK